MRDGVVNYSGFVTHGLTGIILVPVMLRCLGSEPYGLWLAALATYGMLSGFDFGLHWSVTREISAALNAGPSDETVGFVLAAGNLYLLLGITGAVLIATLGLPISAALHLSAHSKRIAPALFLVVAAIFVADRLVLFTTATLSGLRRFRVINAISAGAALVRLMGSLALLWMGRSILAIAVWNLVVSVLWVWVALEWVGSIEPRFRFQLGRLRWRLVRPHLSFSVLSFLTAVAVKIIWDMAPFVIGFFQGSAFIVPYSIGRRFPIALNHVNSRAAETFFPAASERMSANDSAGTRGILQLGTRWILVMALPVCITLCLAASNLLHAWVGTSMPDAVLIMRLTCIAVLAQALGMGAMQVLWGRGAARTIFVVFGVLAIPSLALTVGLVRTLGDVGAALSLCVSLFSSACIFVLLGARACRLRVTELVGETFRGLLLPNAVCAACTYGVIRLTHPQHWIGVIASCLVGGATYIAVLYFAGAREEEKQFVRQALGLQPAPLRREV
jgi:O-antigen/teichoic acid export membrane protein